MAIALELSQSSTVQFGKYTAQTTGTFGMQDLTNFVMNSAQIQIQIVDSTIKMTHGFNTYYKMQGYNTSTQTFENWHCMGTPLMVAPSGNALVDVSIVSIWVDR